MRISSDVSGLHLLYASSSCGIQHDTLYIRFSYFAFWNSRWLFTCKGYVCFVWKKNYNRNSFYHYDFDLLYAWWLNFPALPSLFSDMILYDQAWCWPACTQLVAAMMWLVRQGTIQTHRCVPSTLQAAENICTRAMHPWARTQWVSENDASLQRSTRAHLCCCAGVGDHVMVLAEDAILFLPGASLKFRWLMIALILENCSPIPGSI